MRTLVVAIATTLVAGCQAERAAPEPAAPAVHGRVAVAPTTREPGLADLPTGPPPRIGYLAGSTYVDGRDRIEIRLPHRASVTSVVVFDGGRLVGDDRYFEGTNGLFLLTDRATRHLGGGFFGTSGTGAASPDGRTVAWATFGVPETGIAAPIVLHRRTADEESTQELPLRQNRNARTAVVGLLDGDVVFHRGFGEGAFRTDLCSEPRRIRTLAYVTTLDEHGGLLAGGTDADGDRYAVVDGSTGAVRWRTRGALQDFSPDGSLLIASERRGSTIVDARTGTVLHELTAPVGTRLHDLAWEDDDHLLGVAHSRGRAAIVRIDLDGGAELATPVIRSRPRGTGYRLTHQP